MSNNYVVYHCHTDLSNGVTNVDSTTKIGDYVNRAKQLGMTALGFSEHGSVFSWVEKKDLIEAAGMKYIHAEEFYVCNRLFKYDIDGSFLDFNSEKDADAWLSKHAYSKIKRVRENRHVVLVAKNYDGVKELNRLSSTAFNRNDGHFYFVPRITMDELEHTSDNILITSACLASPLRGDFGKRFLDFLVNNKERCYLEIQHHNTDGQKEYNKWLIDLHNQYGIRLIAGTDTHSLDQDHAEARELLQHSKDVFFDGEDGFDLTFKTFEELSVAYGEQGVVPKDVYADAIEETNRMADRIEPFVLDRSHKYPHLWSDPEGTFKQKINNGVKRRGIQKYPNYKEYVERIQYEYSVFKHNGAIDFILLMDDIVQYCREHDIQIGWGRGSVNGSVICWLLGITEMDSIKWGLNFERFMNTERVSLSDIDTDFPPDRRDEVIEYLFHRAGLYCSDIITFNTIALKGTIRDVCRGLYRDNEKKDYLSITNEICHMADEDEDKARKKYPEVFRYVDICKGTIISIGTHACGRLVYDHPLDDIVGICSSKDDERPISQLWMHELDEQNYVKLDLLGLDTIQLISNTCKMAGIPMLNPETMDIYDDKVWNSMRDDTTAIFQWESSTAQDYIKKLLSDVTIQKFKDANGGVAPDKMELLTIGNSAIRPAGASYRDDLAYGVVRRTGNKAIDDFLGTTYGYLVYQCQIIEFLNQYCGFTMGEADIVRRGFAKKSGTEQYIPIIKDGGYMPSDKQKKHHIDGFIATMKNKYGMNNEAAEKDIIAFLRVIEDASNYLFSRNHSMPYSFEGYACAWLRYYYPLQFITTALNISIGKEEKTMAVMKYAEKIGVTISPPRFEHSDNQYTFDESNNTIFKGVASIKGIGVDTGSKLFAASKNNYHSFVDFLADSQLHKFAKKNEIESLTHIGYFNKFGPMKKLDKINSMFQELYGRKNLKKEKCDSLGISHTMVASFANKETDTQYTGVDIAGLLNEIEDKIPDDEYDATRLAVEEAKVLGYTHVVDPSIDWRYAIVLGVDAKYTPKVNLYCINNGKTTTFKVRKTMGRDYDIKMTWKDLPLDKSDIVYIRGCKRQRKMIKKEGHWIKSGEMEWLLTDYSKM